jgi:NDP-sugar pyrophosphorylase family protein
MAAFITRRLSMADSVPAAGGGDVAAVVLAAGAGERLRPLTFLRPKALCPVGNVALVDLALDRVGAVVGGLSAVAVNVHHGRAQMAEHLAGRGVHLSFEEPMALGTAGALGFLRPWLDGRSALVVNADAWSTGDLDAFVRGWDRRRVRIMAHGDEPFGPRSQIVASLMPASLIAGLEPVPSGLYERCWRLAAERGALETVASSSPFVDCGSPRHYLDANLAAIDLAGGAPIVHPTATVGPDAGIERSVIGAGATVLGRVVRSVVWDGAQVAPHEQLLDAIRTDRGTTVLVR